MQTFILDFDYKESFRMLDSRRLLCQLKESLQLAQYITGEQFLNGKFNPNAPHANHPCVKMWKDYQWDFIGYINANRQELNARGLAEYSHMHDAAGDYENYVRHICSEESLCKPHWLDNDFIYRHRNALLYKSYVKWEIYSWSYNYSQPINKVAKDHLFIDYILRKSIITDDDNFPTLTSTKIATEKAVDKEYYIYSNYRLFFNDMFFPYRVDYKWG